MAITLPYTQDWPNWPSARVLNPLFECVKEEIYTWLDALPFYTPTVKEAYKRCDFGTMSARCKVAFD
jgi:hypothetical protein